ncbi:MAG: thiamine ABC transporter substrate-binding protein [Treponema sp.]|nr:thiamine ABC transporter substrate-binding protein [Treponema sp.]
MNTRYFGLLSIIMVLCNTYSIAFGAKDTSLDPERQKEVVVYAYDSFVSEWGPGPEIKKLFEDTTGYTLTYVDCSVTGQVLSRAIIERDNPQADILLGIDNQLYASAKDQKILIPYKSKNAAKITDETLVESLGGFWLLTPYDYGEFAFIYDTQSSVPAPTSLQDLTKPEYNKKIILMDPRTSTPGAGFVAWTVSVFGEAYLDYWTSLKPSILTMSPNWSGGYGLFTKGEAPLVISYTTSPAYHVEYENTDRFQAILFDEGHIRQVEGAGIVKGAPNYEGAKAFIDFLITDEAQRIIPLTQWMYPVNSSVPLPKCFETSAPQAHTILHADTKKVDKATNAIINLLSQ